MAVQDDPNGRATARCEDVQELVEVIAAEELAPTPNVVSHLASCPRCDAEVLAARRLERLLASRVTPQAPAHFAASVLRRARQERWRSEQFFDVGFNVTIAASLALVVGGVWLLLHASGLEALAAGTLGLGADALAELLRRVQPALPAYGAATTLVAAAVAVWWWVERGDPSQRV
jgi:anti-sigma factor RsiW